MKDNTMRFRDFLKNWNKLSFTEREKRELVEGFMVGLGMFAFFYALLTAPDFIPQSYVSPYASKILFIGFVYALGTALRWQYFEWRKGATGEFQEVSLLGTVQHFKISDLVTRLEKLENQIGEKSKTE